MTGREVALADLLSRDPRFAARATEADHEGLQHPALRFREVTRREDFDELRWNTDALLEPKVEENFLAVVTTAPVKIRERRSAKEQRRAQRKSKPKPNSRALTADSLPEGATEVQGPRGESLASRETFVAAQREDPAPESADIVYDQDGLTWHVDPKENTKRLYVPRRDWQREILRLAHDAREAGHLSAKRTRQRVTEFYYWPRMATDIQEYCDSCAVCKRTKPGGRPLGLLSPLPIPFRKWQNVSMDFVSGLGNGEYKSAMVVCDMLTKMVVIIPTQARLDDDEADSDERVKLTAETAAELYWRHVWRLHGLPKRIVSDRDPRFASHFWRALWSHLDVHLNMSTAGYPQTDGQTERTIRTVVQMLRAFVQDVEKDDWHTLIPTLEYAYNSSVHGATGYSPMFLSDGQEPHSTLGLWMHGFGVDNGNSNDPSSVEGFLARNRDALQRARAHVEAAHESYARSYNRKRSDKVVEVDDWVWVKNADRIAKLDPLFVGPFRVTEARGKWVTISRAGRRFDRVNLDKVQLHQSHATEVDDRDIEEHRVALHDDPEERERGTSQLQLRVRGNWISAYEYIDRGKEDAWIVLDRYLRDHLPPQTGDVWRPDAVGARTVRRLGRSGEVDGIVIEYDPSMEEQGYGYYRVLNNDGDDEDLGEGEFEKAQRAYVRKFKREQKRTKETALNLSTLGWNSRSTTSASTDRALVLCSGTGSVDEVLRDYGYDVDSVDIDEQWGATFVESLAEFRDRIRRGEVMAGDYDVIWASPPCTEYSRAKTRGVRDLPGADQVVLDAIHIIEELKPRVFFIENPVGLLATRSFMTPLEPLRNTVSYCRYGRPFRKNTHIWTNGSVEVKRCSMETPCLERRVYGRHLQTAQQGPSSGMATGQASIEVVYAIPRPLLESLFNQTLS